MKKPIFYRQFDYNKDLLPNHYLKDLEKITNNIDDAKKHTGFSIGYPGWNVIYFLILTTIKQHSKNIILLETGTNVGATTIVLAQALKDLGCINSRVVSLEIDKSYFTKANTNINKSGLTNFVELINEDSIEYLKKLNHTEIDFAFLDGSHTMSTAYNEFEIIFPILKKNSLIILDNTYNIADEGEDQRVFGALNKIKENFNNISIINLPFVSWYTPGLAIIQKN